MARRKTPLKKTRGAKTAGLTPKQKITTQRSLLAELARLPFRLGIKILVLLGTPTYFLLAALAVLNILFLENTFRNLQFLRSKISLRLHRSKPKRNAETPASTVGAARATGIVLQMIPASVYILLLVLFVAAAASTAFYQLILKDLPRPETLLTRQPIITTKIMDRNGLVLYNIYKDQNRTIVPLERIPVHLRQATIAIEDREFYSHKGFSLRGILRALKANLEKQDIQGGSTITQQLIKNTLLSPERTIRRKVKEVVLAVWVETKISKDDILAMYFNEVSYGGSLHGAEAASRAYFNKSVNELSLAESAFLAGLPQAPSTYSPFGPKPELGNARQQLVLQRMVEDGYITSQQAQEAQAQQLKFQPDRNDIKAPHFVMYVRELLAKQFGEDVVSQGGLQVWTTLDYNVQQTAEKAVLQELERLKQMRVKNGAALVTNPMTGEVLAMVGSHDYFDIENDGQVNVTIRPRQPGSSIKPLTYATALERGLVTPSTTIEDAPVVYKSVGSPPYAPKNYDGAFHGKVSVRTALANSYNIPAVKTLASVGVQTVVEKGRQLGITTWDDAAASRFGLALTLGGGEVLMTDMARVFGTFAANGQNVPLNPILKVENYKGETKYENPCLPGAGKPELCPRRQVLDPRIAYQITDILSDNLARAPAFGLHSVLTIPDQQVAVKTGTTNNLRDNWTDGYISDRVVITWVGNNDNAPMSRVASGITGASPIWNTIMRSLLKKDAPHTFRPPENLIKLKICADTGTLPCGPCPKIREEWFLPGSEPKSSCTQDSLKLPEKKTSSRDKILEGISTED